MTDLLLRYHSRKPLRALRRKGSTRRQERLAAILLFGERHALNTADAERAYAFLWDRLKYAMARSRVLHCSPAALGYPDLPTWRVPAARYDLVTDLLLYLERRSSLKTRYRRGEPLKVLLKTRQFINDRRRKTCPERAVVFDTAKKAVMALVRSEEVSLDSMLSTATVIRFKPRISSRSIFVHEDLECLLSDWPMFLLARWNRRDPSRVDCLCELVRGLRSEGVERFRFRSLVKPLCRDVVAWQSSR